MDALSHDEKPALILIGFQNGIDEIEYWGPQRNNHNAENNARQLLDGWRSMGFPVIHIQLISNDPDSPLQMNKPGSKFKDELLPGDGEFVIENMDGACTGADLRKILSDQGVKKVVFAGVPTDRCVASAIHMVYTYGYEAFVVYDATAAFGRPNPRIREQMFSAELIHDTTLASLNHEFASVVFLNELITAMNYSSVEVGMKDKQ